MKIAIIENFFNRSIIFRSGKKSTNKLLQYKKYKLNKLIKELKKKYNNLDITVFYAEDQKISLDKDIKIDIISEFRINIDRNEFLKIKENIVKETTRNFRQFVKNLLNLKTFHYKGIFLGKLFEFYIVLFFNEILGEFEIVKKKLGSEKFDKIILFNANPLFFDFYRYLNKKFSNIEIYRDNLLEWHMKISDWLKFKYLFPMTVRGIRNMFIPKNLPIKKQNTILFISNTNNHYKSLSPIYRYFKRDKEYNPIYYSDHPRLDSLKKYPELLNFLLIMRKDWKNNLNKISFGMNYNSLKLKCLLNQFYYNHFFLYLTSTFNNHYYFEKFIKKIQPSIVVLADSLSAEGRLYTKYCKLKNIPTVYVPHAGTAVYDELITKSDFSYSTVSGEFGKKYLISKGENEEKIFITGRARYTDIYSDKIKTLKEIKDIYSNRIYKFEPKKFTILYTTNPFGNTIIRKIIIAIVDSLKKLNLIDNLIIKLHPRENGMIYKSIFKDLNLNPVIVKDYDLFELIKSSNLLLGGRSTTILESMITGIPVILLDLFNFDFVFTGKYEFCNEKYVITVRNQSELTEQLQKLVNDIDFYKSYSDQLKEKAKFFSYFSEEEDPTEKITNLIKNLLRKKIN